MSVAAGETQLFPLATLKVLRNAVKDWLRKNSDV
jgi:hypothetical protein